MNGKIYMLTNTITGHQYIGQTFEDVSMRIYRGYGLTTQIGRAIQRDGRSSFRHEILKDGITSRQDLNYWENYYINYHRTLYPNGYNEMMA